MSNCTTLFEYEEQAFDWSEAEMKTIERLNQALGATVLTATIRNGVKVIKATQFVGVFRLGTRSLQVLPKMFRAEDPNQVEQATRNLLYLLEYTGQSLIKRTAIAALTRKNLDWFELLTYLFASNLRDEWQRGAYRNYQTVEAVSPVLKGKWRLSEQLRRPEQKHRFAVAYDEFTANTLFNQVFRFVVEQLWKATRDTTNQRILSELRQWMDEVALLTTLTAQQLETLSITRLNQRFEPLLNLARLFVDRSSLQLTTGDLTTFAFVFDMNKLFEEFAIAFTQRHREEILPHALQDCELLPQARGAVRCLARLNDRDVFQLKPDLVFRQASTFPLLLDTKYKILNERDSKLNVSQSDIYQMLAYAYRYECSRVILIYPQTAAIASLRETFQIANSATKIMAATVDLRQMGNRDRLISEFKQIIGGHHERLEN